ncbi:retropepsin-like aspartic protease [Deinococcus yavapaiensis]|uniref:Aspartyl protease n=1 Tax=Deinococcus yavapaiensis KR-236 TaxID=694435 RepID=A0A318S6V2_9DEIO|nr:retropepsin-like aspartic protease [Deinococcus yavapaiensis]PYE54041.1 aspartyl protease [Deinococcus yavapaiensis KR-236]
MNSYRRVFHLISTLARRGRAFLLGMLANLNVPVWRSKTLHPKVLQRVRRGSEVITEPRAIDVPMVGDPTLPLVEVHLNGRGPFRFLLDLGANVVSIREDVAEQIGLATVQALRTRSVVRADTLEIGATTFNDVHIVREPVLDVDGVIGFNVFRDGLVTLDYPAQRFQWHPGALPPVDGREIVSYELRERMPYVQVNIASREVWANLDTGARAELIVPAKLESTIPIQGRVQEGKRLWNQAEGNIKTRTAALAGYVVIGAHVAAVEPTVTFASFLEDEFLIGSGSLVDVRLTLDAENKRLLIQGSSRGT